MKAAYALTIASLGFILGACSHDGHNHREKSVEENHEHKHADEIILAPEDASRFGVETETIKLIQFNRAINVTGELASPATSTNIVTARTSGKITLRGNIVPGAEVKKGQVIGSISASGFEGGDPSEAAAISLDAAKKELDRVTPLYKEGIVSQKDYMAAEAAYRVAKASYSGSKGGSTVTAPANGRISRLMVSQNQFLSAGDPVLEIVGTRNLTLKANLPSKYFKLLPEIISAQFKTPESNNIWDISKMNGRLVSGVNNIVTEGGYIPVQFDFENTENLAAGTYADIYLVCQQADSCIALPKSAITEELGTKYVFVKVDDHGYQKRLVTTAGSDGERTVILSGVNPGEEVVTQGTVFVKLAQTKNVVPEGHSHNH